MKGKKYMQSLAALEDKLFPEALSDEAACATRDCLQATLMAFESRYLSQLMRHERRKPTLYDCEHPWRMPPPL
jgi:hypothetical protein